MTKSVTVEAAAHYADGDDVLETLLVQFAEAKVEYDDAVRRLSRKD